MTFEELVKSEQVDIRKRAVISIVYTQTILGDKLNEMLKPYDLSPEQFNVLRILRGNKGKPANMSTIQERMIAKTSNTTRLIDKLLAKDLVSRQVCPNNRRKMEVNITDKGLSLLCEIDPKMNRHEESSTRNLTQKELEQLIDLLDKIRN